MPTPKTNVWLLTLIQSLVMCVGTMMVLVGGVFGAQIAPMASMSTLPLAMMIVGLALGVLPITRLMQHVGRRPVFMALAIIASLVCLFAALCVYQRHFWGFTLSSFCLGITSAGFQQIRFAAMEAVVPEKMAKAASTVLLGGLVAAFLGPQLVSLGTLVSHIDFVGAFVLMAVLLVVCSVLFRLTLNTHVPRQAHLGSGRNLLSIARQPEFVLAVSASVVGYALMSFIMTATPMHMHVMEHHSLQHTSWVIQSHIFAMFFPSLFSGWLISKIGVRRIIGLGVVAYLITIVVGLSGSHLINYWLALVLLGIGWNFLFVGGTVLLTQTYRADEKFKVQGLNEMLVFGCQALAALSAGIMLSLLGWQGLLLTSLFLLSYLLVLLLFQRLPLPLQIKQEFL